MKFKIGQKVICRNVEAVVSSYKNDWYKCKGVNGENLVLVDEKEMRPYEQVTSTNIDIEQYKDLSNEDLLVVYEGLIMDACLNKRDLGEKREQARLLQRLILERMGS